MSAGPGGVSQAAPRPIRVLPDDLANQIAAGEVVERPGSVAKELIENSFDAGATRIRVDVEGGGLALLRVADDGRGMSRDDASVAVLRHATSKIAALEDLRRIESFGFRGEALPSIASVSRFCLRTRREAEEEGTEVSIEGGGPPRVAPCGLAAGTVVEVRDLFFNVPARRKFLRAVATESAQVTEVAQAAALARPDATVVLSRDGRVVREWLRASSREERVKDALGEQDLVACCGQRGPLSVEAFVSRPERARSGAAWLSLFVNGRHIKDRTLARAVAQAYGSVLEPGRYPIGAVFLDLPHDLVDVNVHPQKAEVRFSDGRAIADALFRIVTDTVSTAFGIPAQSNRFDRRPKLWDDGPAPALSTWSWTSAPGAIPAGEPDPWGLSGDEAGRAPDGGTQMSVPLPTPIAYPTASELPSPAGAAPRVQFSALRFLVQVRRMFLVCEAPDGMYVLDQHAAAERVTFHRLKSSFATRQVATQRLLIPEVVQVSPAEVALVEEGAEQVIATGLDVRPAGPSSVSVHAVPQLLARASPERLVKDLLAELARAGERAFSGAIDLALATMACHGSIRAGDAVAPAEAGALLAALDEVDFAGHCPHGRPIVMRIGWMELEQRVGRR